jgi:hypothetical protein
MFGGGPLGGFPLGSLISIVKELIFSLINAEARGKEEASEDINAETTGGGIKTIIEAETRGQEKVSDDIDAETIGIVPLKIAKVYRILVKDENGNFIGEFDKFKSLKFNKRLNNYGMASFEIPANDDKASELISLRQYTIEIYQQVNANNVLVWAGEQAAREGKLDSAGNNWITIYCYTWFEQLKNRFTRAFRRFDGIDAGQIAWGLIEETQKNYQYENSIKNTPQTASNDASYGDHAWSYTDTNLQTSIENLDEEYCTIEPDDTEDSNYLKITNFNFAIPTEAEILGIKVEFNRYVDQGATNFNVYDSRVRIVKGGTIQSDEDKAKEDAWILGYDNKDWEDYGGEEDLWTQTWTPADINNSGFGVAISAYVSGVGPVGLIDNCRITVYYREEGDYGDFGITEGDIETTIDRDRSYYNQNILEAIINLSNVISGFDFEITDEKVFNVASIIGEDKTNEVVLEYGHNIANVRILEDFINPVNRAIVLGEPTDDNTLARIERENTTLQETYKVREEVLSDMEISETDTFEEKGDAMLRKYENPLINLDIDTIKDPETDITDFSLGDSIKLIIKDGIYNIDADFRIFEWSVEIDEMNVEKINLILGNFTL